MKGPDRFFGPRRIVYAIDWDYLNRHREELNRIVFSGGASSPALADFTQVQNRLVQQLDADEFYADFDFVDDLYLNRIEALLASKPRRMGLIEVIHPLTRMIVPAYHPIKITIRKWCYSEMTRFYDRHWTWQEVVLTVGEYFEYNAASEYFAAESNYELVSPSWKLADLIPKVMFSFAIQQTKPRASPIGGVEITIDGTKYVVPDACWTLGFFLRKNQAAIAFDPRADVVVCPRMRPCIPTDTTFARLYVEGIDELRIIPRSKLAPDPPSLDTQAIYSQVIDPGCSISLPTAAGKVGLPTPSAIDVVFEFAGKADVDGSVSAFDLAGEELSTAHFGAKSAAGGALLHAGDDRRAGGRETVVVDLAALPADVRILTADATSVGPPLSGTTLKIFDHRSQKELIRTAVKGGKNGTIGALFYKDDAGVWQYWAIGEDLDATTPVEAIPLVEAWLKQNASKYRIKLTKSNRLGTEVRPGESIALADAAARMRVQTPKSIDIAFAFSNKADVDGAVTAFDEEATPLETACFSSKAVAGGALVHTGDRREGGEREAVVANLSDIEDVVRILTAEVTSFAREPLTGTVLTVSDHDTGQRLIVTPLDGGNTGMLSAVLWRDEEGAWHYLAVGELFPATTPAEAVPPIEEWLKRHAARFGIKGVAPAPEPEAASSSVPGAAPGPGSEAGPEPAAEPEAAPAPQPAAAGEAEDTGPAGAAEAPPAAAAAVPARIIEEEEEEEEPEPKKPPQPAAAAEPEPEPEPPLPQGKQGVELSAGDSIAVDAACAQAGVPACTVVNLCLSGAAESVSVFDAAFETLGVCAAGQTPALGQALAHSKRGGEEVIRADLAGLPPSARVVAIHSIPAGGVLRLCDPDGTELAFVKRNEDAPSLLYALLLKDDDGRWWFAHSLHGFDVDSLERLTPAVAEWLKSQQGQLDEAMKEAPVVPAERNIVPPGGTMSLAEACERYGVRIPANMDICLGWESSADLDCSLAVFNPALKVTETASFAMPYVVNSLIKHNGDSRRRNQKGDHESISVKLASLPDTVKGVCIQITSYKSGDLSHVKGTYVRLVDRDTKMELIYTKVSQGEPKHGFFYAVFYRDEDDWAFTVANQYYDAVKPSEMVPPVEAWLKASGLFEVAGKKKKRRGRKKKVAPQQERNPLEPGRVYSLEGIAARYAVPPPKTIDICFAWTTKADLDASVAAFDPSYKMIATASFAAPKILNLAVIHHGDDKFARGKGDDQVISVKLSKLPPEVAVIGIVITSSRGVPFSEVKAATVRIRVKKSWLELGHLSVKAGEPKPGFFFAALIRNGKDWNFVPQIKYYDGKKPSEVVKSVEAFLHTPAFATQIAAPPFVDNSPLSWQGKAPTPGNSPREEDAPAEPAPEEPAPALADPPADAS
jgi:stress response protein SCP2